MLLTFKRIVTKPTPQIEINIKKNAQGWPEDYHCNFLEPGIANYEDVHEGIALLKKETMDTWVPSTFKNRPVVIDHQDITPENYEKLAVGYITNAYYNPSTGWYDCDFIITKDEGHEKIAKGWSVSCSFGVVDSIKGLGEWHANKYTEEITKGEGLHLAIVENPRYEDCRITKNNNRIIYNSKKAVIKTNDTNLTLMSTMQLDKYLGGLSDPGLQTIIDGEHDESIKKIAKMHQGDRATKKEEELMAVGSKEKKNGRDLCPGCGADVTKEKEGPNGIICPKCHRDFWRSETEKKNMVELTKKGGSMKWSLFAKKQDKASIENDKIDASKVFVKVDDEMVPLSTLMNSVGDGFEMLEETDKVKINGKDVEIGDLVKAYKANDKKTKKDDEKEEEEEKEKKKKEDEKKKDDEKKMDDDKKKCDEKEEKEKKDDDKKKDDSKENKKDFYVDLKNANRSVVDEKATNGGADTREDKALRGKKMFSSKKK